MAATRRSSMKKPTSAAKIAANRLNGKNGTGPKDTSVTRFNAVTHGLSATGITELDDAAGYRDMLRDLQGEKKPVGVLRIDCSGHYQAATREAFGRRIHH